MFLGEPPRSDLLDAVYDEERRRDGYVRNTTRIWGWRPDALRAFYDARAVVLTGCELSWRDATVLFAAAASARKDSYCALHWGQQVATELGTDSAVAVLRNDPDPVDDRVAALARWAHLVASDPNSVTSRDVDALRAVLTTDKAVFEATMLVAWRIAFLTVKDALGAAPDAELAASVPAELLAVVTYGRAPAQAPGE
jgi:alkylhydroperoxidase family enzyme